MEALNIFWSNAKWRLKNPQIIVMTIIQPLLWLVLFTSQFKGIAMDNNIDMNYTAFALPGILVLLILSSAGMSGIYNYSWREKGIFLKVYIAPIKRISMLIGHILDSLVISLIEIAVLYLISLAFDVHIKTGVVGAFIILLTLVLTHFFVASISYVLSLKIKDENSFIAVINTCMIPLFFASSALVSVDMMPTLLKMIVKVNPFTYSIDLMRSLIIQNQIEWSLVGKTYILLIILCCFFGFMATRKLFSLTQKRNFQFEPNK